MIQDIASLFELRRPAAAAKRSTQPVSTLAFDALYAVLCIVLTLGIFIDVWSHDSFGPDQSVLSPYHFLFYSAMATLGITLLYIHNRNLSAGYRWAQALPVGYGFSFLGVIAFASSGAVDLAGHALFGFETGIEAIMSPTHMLLFISWFVVSLAPIRAAMARWGASGRPTLLQQVPLMLAIMSALCALTLVTFYFVPLSDYSTGLQALRGMGDVSAQTAEISAIFVQTGVLMAFFLWILRYVTVRIGVLALVLLAWGALLSIITSDSISIVNAVIAGVGLEVLRLLVQPRPDAPSRLVLFGFLAPIVMWGLYYTTFVVTNAGGGMWVTGYVWMGTVFQSGFIGLVLAYFITRGAAPTGEHS